MPVMEVTVPALQTAAKGGLASDLTAAYAGATGIDPMRIGIRFLEYGRGETAYGGELDGRRPLVHVVLYCPEQPGEVKRTLVQGINAALQAALDLPACRPVIHIQEHPLDNVGVDGELLSDR